MRPLPNSFPITCGFGVRGTHWAAGYHTGVDFGCPTGTKLEAPHRGVVTTSAYDPSGYGHYVVIEGMTLRGKRRWLLAHLSERRVTAGNKVKRGQVIGLSGETGNTTGPHVHAEQRHSPFGYWDHEKPTVLLEPYQALR